MVEEYSVLLENEIVTDNKIERLIITDTGSRLEILMETGEYTVYEHRSLEGYGVPYDGKVYRLLNADDLRTIEDGYIFPQSLEVDCSPVAHVTGVVKNSPFISSSATMSGFEYYLGNCITQLAPRVNPLMFSKIKNAGERRRFVEKTGMLSGLREKLLNNLGSRVWIEGEPIGKAVRFGQEESTQVGVTAKNFAKAVDEVVIDGAIRIIRAFYIEDFTATSLRKVAAHAKSVSLEL